MFMLSWRDDGLVGIGLPLVCLGLSGIVLGDISHPAMAWLFWGLLLPAVRCCGGWATSSTAMPIPVRSRTAS